MLMKKENYVDDNIFIKRAIGAALAHYMVYYVIASDTKLAKRGRRLIEETLKWMTGGIGSYIIPFRLIFDDDDEKENSWLDEYELKHKSVVSSLLEFIKKWLYFTLRIWRRTLSNMVIQPLLSVPRDLAWVVYWFYIWAIALRILTTILLFNIIAQDEMNVYEDVTLVD